MFNIGHTTLHYLVCMYLPGLILFFQVIEYLPPSPLCAHLPCILCHLFVDFSTLHYHVLSVKIFGSLSLFHSQQFAWAMLVWKPLIIAIKSGKQKGQESFCTAVRQMLISQALPNLKKKKSFVSTCCVV